MNRRSYAVYRIPGKGEGEAGDAPWLFLKRYEIRYTEYELKDKALGHHGDAGGRED